MVGGSGRGTNTGKDGGNVNKERPVTRHGKGADPDSKVVPVIREELKVDKRTEETGVTRIRKTVQERQETVDVPLRVDEVEVERVPVGRYVDAPVEVRQEGDTTIIPVLEEVLVVEKRLLLKEELHVRKRSREVRDRREVTLRGEKAVVEHEDLQGAETDPVGR
jgi:uncharacterized protein (TIGR02271 family)